MDCFGTYFTHAQSCDNVHVQSATGRTASVHTHAQSCDNVHVQSATDWAASVHTLHMPKAVIKFVFEVYGMDCWRTYLTHAQICDNISCSKCYGMDCVFAVFAFSFFSRFRAWRFRVFVFRRRHPGAGTQISCAQISNDPWKEKTRSPCWAKGTCDVRRPQVRQAFRSKARLWHPDRGGDPERSRVPGGEKGVVPLFPDVHGSSLYIPIGSMGLVYIYTHIYHENQPNVGKHTIHGWYI